MSKRHCRMLQMEQFFRQSRMLLRHCCSFWQRCRTKFHPLDKVETNWTCLNCYQKLQHRCQNGNIVVKNGNNVEATFVLVTKTIFYDKLVWHCCRFRQQSQTLLRHCCGCGRRFRVLSAKASSSFCTYVHGGLRSIWVKYNHNNFYLCPFWKLTYTGQTRRQIFTHDGWNDADSLKNVSFLELFTWLSIYWLKLSFFWAWISVFKPNSRNRKTCILSKLRHRFQPNFAPW